MSIEIGARIGNVNLGATLASRSQQRNDMASQMQHESGDVVRDANRRSPLAEAGPLEQLLATPSPLDRLAESRK